MCRVFCHIFKKSKIKFNNSYHFHLSHTNFHDTQNIQAQFDEKYLIKVKSSTMNEYLPESDWKLGGKKELLSFLHKKSFQYQVVQTQKSTWGRRSDTRVAGRRARPTSLLAVSIHTLQIKELQFKKAQTHQFLHQ